MRRRELLRVIGLSAVVWPLTAHGQERIRRIGVLMGLSATDPEGQKQAAALRRGLEELGWSSGRNIEIDFRWYGGDVEKARALARELVELRPDLLVLLERPHWPPSNRQPGQLRSCLSMSPIRWHRASCKA